MKPLYGETVGPLLSRTSERGFAEYHPSYAVDSLQVTFWYTRSNWIKRWNRVRRTMDESLLPYVQAIDDSKRQELLEDLLLFHAGPIIRQTLWRRLGFHVSQSGSNRNNQDAEDLFQETILRITQALRDLHSSPQATDIEDFDKYVARTAINACNNFLRGRSPARTRLKDNIQSLLTRHPDFAIWKHREQIVGGFAIWKNKRHAAVFGQELNETLEAFRDARFAAEDIKLSPLPKVVAELFMWVDGPVEIDALVSALVGLLQVKDHPNESLDDELTMLVESRIADNSLSAASALEAKELLSRTWQVVKRLPQPQRDAYCLTFEDQSGVDLFSLLLEARVATPAQIAEGLGRSLEEIVRLRAELPMDKARAAAELNATRRQVYKWRFLAARTLKEELLP